MPNALVAGFPHWMIGQPEDLMQSCIDDLAKMHGQFWQSPELDTLVPPAPEYPGVGMKEGSFNSTFIGFSLAPYGPFPNAEAMGYEAGTTGIPILSKLMTDLKDYLQVRTLPAAPHGSSAVAVRIY